MCELIRRDTRRHEVGPVVSLRAKERNQTELEKETAKREREIPVDSVTKDWTVCVVDQKTCN